MSVTVNNDEQKQKNVQIFKQGLHTLGKTFNNARHAYLSLSIADKQLSSICGIEKYIYLQNIDVSNNQLESLKELSTIRHLLKLNASNNRITKMLDFDPPANLQQVNYSGNQITHIENCDKNVYIKELYLDGNQIKKIEGLSSNKSLRILSINYNNIEVIENLDDLWIEELFLARNHIKRITGVNQLQALRTIDLSKNQISKLQGLETVQNLKFLNMSLNNIQKVQQMSYIEILPFLTELDLCFNPIQNKKHYRLQILYHIPQLRMLDGNDILSEEKIKAQNLHGNDINDRQVIFDTLLPQENFVDRRINIYEDIEQESEDEDQANFVRQSNEMVNTAQSKKVDLQLDATSSVRSNIANSYVGDLITTAHQNKHNII